MLREISPGEVRVTKTTISSFDSSSNPYILVKCIRPSAFAKAISNTSEKFRQIIHNFVR